jgi:hypothetical protein
MQQFLLGKNMFYLFTPGNESERGGATMDRLLRGKFLLTKHVAVKLTHKTAFNLINPSRFLHKQHSITGSAMSTRIAAKPR